MEEAPVADKYEQFCIFCRSGKITYEYLGASRPYMVDCITKEMSEKNGYISTKWYPYVTKKSFKDKDNWIVTCRIKSNECPQ